MRYFVDACFVPAHWNRVCAQTIPASYDAEVHLAREGSREYVSLVEGLDYSTLDEARAKAKAWLVERMKARGLSGSLVWREY